jgi:hypothetical protein
MDKVQAAYQRSEAGGAYESRTAEEDRFGRTAARADSGLVGTRAMPANPACASAPCCSLRYGR